MTETKATPIEQGALRSSEEELKHQLSSASDTAKKVDSFKTYSSERCVELNSSGATWDCPEDTTGLSVDEVAVEREVSEVDAILDELGPSNC